MYDSEPYGDARGKLRETVPVTFTDDGLGAERTSVSHLKRVLAFKVHIHHLSRAEILEAKRARAESTCQRSISQMGCEITQAKKPY